MKELLDQYQELEERRDESVKALNEQIRRVRDEFAKALEPVRTKLSEIVRRDTLDKYNIEEGDIVTCPYGWRGKQVRRYRISIIYASPQVVRYKGLAETIVHTEIRGIHIKANGTDGETKSIYPNDIRKIEKKESK